MCDFDIVGVAETFLRLNQSLDLNGYTWFGSNRTEIHHRALRASGGVGFLIKNWIVEAFQITVLDKSFDGILWISLTHKLSGYTLCVCVCYLPPSESTRSQPDSFFDHLVSLCYLYQNLGPHFICGDFNARCGDDEDFIVGIDELPERSVLDFKRNSYGVKLIDFLISSNSCILNGRNSTTNNFTSFNTAGASVVDYCLCPHEQLHRFSKIGRAHV